MYSDITGCPLSVNSIHNFNSYYLFTTYYATSYYGIIQALDIDCIIKIIHNSFPEYKNVLFSCLFYVMKETVFSKDVHMAQPLNPLNNQKRLFSKRKKNIYKLFIQKYKEYTTLPLSKFSGKNKVFNSDFEDLLDRNLFSNIRLVYAHPLYTNMQYSRYYHLLNIAARYNYPDLTKIKRGYTKGLYTEGRYQPKLSNRSYSRQSPEALVKLCTQTDTNFAISYAYLENSGTQPTGRYIISIDRLVEITRKYYTDLQININITVIQPCQPP